MKAILVILMLAVCGFFGASLYLDTLKTDSAELSINQNYLSNADEVIFWNPVKSSVNLAEIPHLKKINGGTKLLQFIEQLNQLFSAKKIEELKIEFYIIDGEWSALFNTSDLVLSSVLGDLISKEVSVDSKSFSGNGFHGQKSKNWYVLASSESLLNKIIEPVVDETFSSISFLNEKKENLIIKTKANAEYWFQRGEIEVKPAADIFFKKRKGFIYAYSYVPDSMATKEDLGVTYSIWDFQLPGTPSNFTIENFPVRTLEKDQISEVEEVCNCDVKTAWKSWNTKQVYLFNQNGISFYGLQCLDDLPAKTGLYPFIGDRSEMYKGYQIQSLITGAEVSGLYADMFGREVSHFIDLEQQLFFFSAISEAKSFINNIQSSSFNQIVNNQLKELLLLSPSYTEFNANSGQEIPIFYQYEKQNGGNYYHALWKSTEKLLTLSTEAEAETEQEDANKGKVIQKWEISLNNPIAKDPFIFQNHYTREKEVLICTEANELRLIDKNGKKLWSRNLDQPVYGNFRQVDLFRNNKYQIVFSTANALYAVDRNGKDVENFPIKYKEKLTAPASVMDYDGKRKYRFLVPLADGSLLNYNADGKEVRGWKHKAESSPIISEVLHTIIGRKDYLISAKKNGKIAIYKRDGKTRYTQDLQLSNYQGGDIQLVSASKIEGVKLVYEDSAKNLVEVSLSLDQNQAVNLGIAEGDQTLIQQIVDKKSVDYLVAKENRLSLYNEDYVLKFSTSFDSVVSSDLYVLDTGKSNLLGFSSDDSVFLLNQRGETIKGFPVYGNGGLALADLDKNGSKELIVADNSGLLICYQLGF